MITYRSVYRSLVGVTDLSHVTTQTANVSAAVRRDSIWRMSIDPADQQITGGRDTRLSRIITVYRLSQNESFPLMKI